MKKLIAGFAVVSVLVVVALAYAHGPGSWNRGGNMMGPGYGGHMMGQEYGGHMMGQGGGHMMGQGGGNMMGWGGSGYYQEFLNETADLRKELHNKKFEYFEALRDPKTPAEDITKLEKDIQGIQESIREKAPRTANRGLGGYGCGY